MGEGSGAVNTSVGVALSCLHRSSLVCAMMADGDGRTTRGRSHSTGDDRTVSEMVEKTCPM
jgi:hypothetical protein